MERPSYFSKVPTTNDAGKISKDRFRGKSLDEILESVPQETQDTAIEIRFKSTVVKRLADLKKPDERSSELHTQAIKYGIFPPSDKNLIDEFELYLGDIRQKIQQLTIGEYSEILPTVFFYFLNTSNPIVYENRYKEGIEIESKISEYHKFEIEILSNTVIQEIKNGETKAKDYYDEIYALICLNTKLENLDTAFTLGETFLDNIYDSEWNDDFENIQKSVINILILKGDLGDAINFYESMELNETSTITDTAECKFYIRHQTTLGDLHLLNRNLNEAERAYKNAQIYFKKLLELDNKIYELNYEDSNSGEIKKFDIIEYKKRWGLDQIQYHIRISLGLFEANPTIYTNRIFEASLLLKDIYEVQKNTYYEPEITKIALHFINICINQQNQIHTEMAMNMLNLIDPQKSLDEDKPFQGKRKITSTEEDPFFRVMTKVQEFGEVNNTFFLAAKMICHYKQGDYFKTMALLKIIPPTFHKDFISNQGIPTLQNQALLIMRKIDFLIENLKGIDLASNHDSDLMGNLIQELSKLFDIKTNFEYLV